jgi:trigger factor
MSGPDDTDVDTAVEDEASEGKLAIDVSVEDVGPCRKHVRVTVPREDLDQIFEDAIGELSDKAEVPGFRTGHAPKDLLRKRFKKELANDVKQKVLMQSLEQVSEDHEIEPIDEPELDVESLEIPEEGDFEYEFEVEVRPQFDLPDYVGLKLERPTREITDAEIDEYMERVLEEFGSLDPVDGAAEAGDFVTADIHFEHDGKELHTLSDVTMRIKPRLQFYDAELPGFEELMTGVAAGEDREAELTISTEATAIEMRGETVAAKFHVTAVRRRNLPELTTELLDNYGLETEEEFREEVQKILDRQIRYEQRQSARRQVLEKITESADWDLPESLVNKQVENALYREILEMQQAGFTREQIQARENELRQRSVTTTRQAMKEHFVLDRIASEQQVDVSPSDIQMEINSMAMQRGENPRRLRARLQKSGVIENLEAQIRERKAIDLVLEKAEFEDVPMPAPQRLDVEAVNRSVCVSIRSVESPSEEEDEDSLEGA